MWTHPVAKEEFLAGSKVAAQILFDAIKQQSKSSQTKAIAALCQPTLSLEDFSAASVEHVACEMLAGSLIVLAYKIIDLHGVAQAKGPGALHFESEINRLIREHPDARIKKEFKIPPRLCVGREVGHLPLGVIVHGARNQYCHFGEHRRLDPLNELVFNHLQQLYADAEWLNFDAKDGGRILAFTATSALHWTANGNDGSTGFERFCEDMSEVIGQPY